MGKMTYIDGDELTLRIAEACMSAKRPVGKSVQEALRECQELWPDGYAGFRRASRAAANYIVECCNTNHPGSVEIKEVIVETNRHQ